MEREGGCAANTDEHTRFFEDVFDKIDDLLDFSDEDLQLLMEPKEPASFEDALVVDSAILPVPDASVESALVDLKGEDDTLLCDGIDAADLEWLSNFFQEESFSLSSDELPDGNTVNICSNNGGGGEAFDKVGMHYRTPSPVSVLENSGLVVTGGDSFCYSASSSPTSPSSCILPASVIRGRAPRTKRPRPASAPRQHVIMKPSVPLSLEDDSDGALLVIPSNNSLIEPLMEYSNSGPAELLHDREAPIVHKKNKLKIVSSAFAGKEEQNSQPTASSLVRKCMHCEIQKTPQWRAGPMGPKTLCNACGVRYKSGRLFPEYRPAASPTFVASQHSNSHKKVVEMRMKASQKQPLAVTPLPASAKGCELLSYIRSSER